jgi:hypothetical protein
LYVAMKSKQKATVTREAKNQRSSKATRKSKGYESKLDLLFDISVPDKQQNRDGLDFLKDQQTVREFKLYGSDPIAQAKQEQRLKYAAEEERRLHKEKDEASHRFESKQGSDVEDEGKT